MKESYIRFRCTETQKELAKALAEASDMTMSEYVMSLIENDSNFYIEKEIFGVLVKKNSIEKISFGYVLVDKDERMRSSKFKKLLNDCIEHFCPRNGQYCYLECEGSEIKPPSAFSDYVKINVKNYEMIGKWWNDKNVELIKINSKIYALNNWNGEEYTDCWEVSENLIDVVDNKSYMVRPINKEVEGKYEIIRYNVFGEKG